jgi:hypothetical protein
VIKRLLNPNLAVKLGSNAVPGHFPRKITQSNEEEKKL